MVARNNLDEADHKFLTIVVSLLSRSVFFICCTVVLCMWISSCELNESTVANCEASCDSFGSHMESATTRECICATTQSTEYQKDAWVIPKAQR
jgi:hypothetical protein